MTPRQAFAAAVFLCMMTLACSTEDQASPNPTNPSAIADEPSSEETRPIFVRPGWTEAVDSTLAEIAGIFEIKNGCGVLVSDDGSIVDLLLWPSGTVWLAADQVVATPDGSLIRQGDRIRSTGGGHVLESGGLTDPLLSRMRDCAESTSAAEVAYINEGAAVELPQTER